ncbi:uncharacterized protein LOC110691890 [Chenopodium quinoa]|uniref:uncharacterized protein LOC110691890 n=1 Tax=Chenopodium quinoa TaxID=63459 RepID=UPI000B7871C5|nr:uncharacterized protein LOC110691890 [Chenopodium quinoa]
MRIANWEVGRILIDGGSSANIIYISAFIELKLNRKDLKRVNYEVTGFNGSGLTPKGIIEISVWVGERSKRRDVRAEFLVINSPSPYNGIMGRPLIHKIGGVVSTYHLAMAYTTNEDEMPGIDPTVMVHKLNVNEDIRPVRQKKRSFSTEKNRAIQEEVEKLLEARFIELCDYPKWLANVVMVKKANGQWKMCVDFTDLNKACPKDCYPLPQIDQLVDSISGHALLSIMDAFSRYHQISLHEPDR